MRLRWKAARHHVRRAAIHQRDHAASIPPPTAWRRVRQHLATCTSRSSSGLETRSPKEARGCDPSAGRFSRAPRVSASAPDRQPRRWHQSCPPVPQSSPGAGDGPSPQTHASGGHARVTDDNGRLAKAGRHGRLAGDEPDGLLVHNGRIVYAARSAVQHLSVVNWL